MDTNLVTTWFSELKRAWVEQDIPAIQNLLADAFEYYEHPFELPFTTWGEVESAWQEVCDQRDIVLSITPLVCTEYEGTAVYEFSCTDPAGNVHHSKGVQYVKLDSAGKSVVFRQWWVSK